MEREEGEKRKGGRGRVEGKRERWKALSLLLDEVSFPPPVPSSHHSSIMIGV